MNKKIKISVDPRIIVVLLLAVIVSIVGLWRPWQSSGDVRKITVAGHSRIKAVPDRYQFNITYQKSGAQQEAALAELNAHINNVIAKLRELGTPQNDIQLQANSYDQFYPKTTQENSVTAHLTIKVADKEMAQKLQNYLLTTGPQGSMTPVPTFSDEKREGLENEARDKAIADAKSEAERTARQLGAKLGKVLEVNDTVAGGIVPLLDRGTSTDSAAPSPEKTLPILSGEQEISFSVQAVFEIK